MSNSLALIGGGNLACCLLKGLLSSGRSQRDLSLIGRREETNKKLRQSYPDMLIANRPGPALRSATLVLLCVKPKDIKTACLQIAPYLHADALLISVAAGVRCRAIRQWTEGKHKVIRCMPNIAVAVGRSMSVLYAEDSLSDEQKQTAGAVFTAVGQSEWIKEEREMDLVTALSGSGPACFFRFVEALGKAAQEQGMPAERARRLSMQTAVGALAYLKETGESASRACQRVSSAGGATERALAALKESGFDAGIERAVAAARQRAQEIADDFDQI